MRTIVLFRKLKFDYESILLEAIYICGGFDGMNVLQSAERYDPRTSIWETIPQMKAKRSGVQVLAFDDKIWALGGFDGTNVSGFVHCYSIAFQKYRGIRLVRKYRI